MHIDTTLKKIIYFSAISVSLLGCAATPRNNLLSSVAQKNDKDQATLYTFENRNSRYFVMDAGACKKNWLGMFRREIIYENFREMKDKYGKSQISVKANRIINVNYSYSMSNETCQVSASFFAKAGKEYYINGSMNTPKCTLQVQEALSGGELINLFKNPLVQENTSCDPSQ